MAAESNLARIDALDKQYEEYVEARDAVVSTEDIADELAAILDVLVIARTGDFDTVRRESLSRILIMADNRAQELVGRLERRA